MLSYRSLSPKLFDALYFNQKTIAFRLGWLRRCFSTEDDHDVDSYGLSRIPFRGYYDVEKCDKRRQWVEKYTSTSLTQLGEWWANEEISTTELKGNAENVIGLAKLPVGVAGPLLIHGDHVNGHVLCPFATTEGAIIASTTRGATALSRAGGVLVHVGKKRMLRAPAFVMRSTREAQIVWEWLKDNLENLKEQMTLSSQHCVLCEIEPHFFGKTLVVRFIYETGDAAGQNMTTNVTWRVCNWALNKIGEELQGIRVEKFYVESNLSGDKKMTAGHLLYSRGWLAQAEAWIPERILRSVLKASKVSIRHAITSLYGFNQTCWCPFHLKISK